MYKYDEARKLAVELRKDHSVAETIRILRRRLSPNKLPLEDRSIRRWLEEKKSVKSPKVNHEYHNNELANIAEQLIANGLDRVTAKDEQQPPWDIFKYTDWKRGGIGITAEKLTDMVKENFETAEMACGEREIHKIFLPHLKAEFLLLEQYGLDYCIKNHPFELIERLIILIHRRKFKGICPVCEEWQ